MLKTKWHKYWKSVILVLITLIGSILFYQQVVPSLKTKLLDYTQTYLKKNYQLDLKVNHVGINLLTATLTLNEVQIINHGSPVLKKELLDQIHLDEMEFSLSFWSLISGKIQPQYLLLNRLTLNLDLTALPATSASQGLDLKPLFQFTPWLNGMSIDLKNLNLNLVVDKKNPTINFQNLSLSTDFYTQIVKYQLKLDKIILPEWNQTLPISFTTHGSIEPDSLIFDSIEFDNPFLTANAQLKVTQLNQLFQNPIFQTKGSLTLKAEDHINAILPSSLKLAGQVQTEFNFQLQDSLTALGQMLIKAEQFKIGHYYIGDLSLKGQLKKNALVFEQFHLNQKEIELKFTQFNLLYQMQPFAISTQAKVDIANFELQNLFQSLNLLKIPVFLKIKGESSCDGTLYPNFKLDCQAQAKGNQLKVTNITQLSSFEAIGEYQIDLHSIKYQSQITIPQQLAKGSSQGEINFRQGFKIKFSGEHIDLAEVSPIAGLKVLGFADTHGEISGNSQQAILDMKIESPDFSFENMHFKKTQTQLTYEKGWLKFNNIQSELPSSQVKGFVFVDLYQSQLEMQFSSPQINGEDIQLVFNDYLFENTINQGKGSLFFKVKGPFNWKNWDTQIKLNFTKLLLLNEYTDQLQIEASVLDDYLKIGPSFAAKGPYRISMSGQGYLKNNALIELSAIDLPLNQMDNISLLNSEINGLMNFKIKLLSPLGPMQILGNFSIDQISLNESTLPSIKGSLKTQTQNTQIQLQYGSDAFLFDLNIPHQANDLAQLDLSTRRFDPRPFFSLIGSSQVVEDYQSSVTLDTSYTFKPANFFQGTGVINISEAFVQRQGSSLQVERPTNIQIMQGWVKPVTLKLSGFPDQKLTLHTEGQLEQNFTCQLKAQLDLQLIHPFLPFLDDLRGQLNSDISITGLPWQPYFQGDLKLSKGQIQFKNLNQSFTQVQSLIRLNDRKVDIAQFKADFGQGQIMAQGSIEYLQWGQIPIQIPIRINNAIIEPIDGARVKTSAELNLSGFQFPYTLSGQINILEGYVSRDFDSGDSTQIKRSSLLPKVIFKQALNPIVLDTQVSLASPIVIRNNLIEGQIYGNLGINGSIYDPKLNGQIRVQEYSKVFFRDNEFRIDNGLIQLNGVASEINPGLVISATSRIDRYDVSLTVNGSVNQPLIRLSSQPVLPEPDLISLLALGQVSTEVERRLQAPSSQSQAEAQIGSVLLQNIPLFKKAQKATGVSVQISSSFDADQNAEFRKISFTKRLGNKTRIVAATGDYGFREFKFEYSLSPKLSAIGRFRQQDFIVNSLNIERQNRADSIFGLDLEYRKEFK